MLIVATVPHSTENRYSPLFDDTPEPDWIDSLGKEYEIVNLYFKPYAACRWAQPAVEAALQVIRAHKLSIENLADITIRTFREAAALDCGYPQTTEAAQYNLSFPLAMAILDGEVGPRQVLPPRMLAPDVREMMDKIQVAVNPQLQHKFPAETLAEAVITTTDGKTLESGITSARWEPPNIPSDDELVEKFHTLVDPVIGSETARTIESMIWEFERCDSVRSLIRQRIAPRLKPGLTD
ncbi:MAG: hypothetical protein AAF716_22635 [Cyanobacteria bacterium P01_D01_bin.1]